ncbi:MAG: portal protein [Gemmatimonas sp.]|nr:portal protein [Gemmatimonas sp.]
MVVAAALFLLPLRLARVPSIVAYIVAGLVLGPATGLLALTDAIEIISEVGIVLLLFLVGLELSLDKIRHVGRAALILGLAQVAATMVGGTALARLLGFDPVESIFLGIALTFSSTVVAVKLLEEKGESESLYGRISIGVLLVQDLVVVAILTLLTGLQDATEVDVAATVGELLRAFGGMGLLIVISVLAARYVLPRPFAWISVSLEALFIWSLGWCFVLVVAAELLHLSVELGAFIAGVSLAQLRYNHELRRRVHPLMNFFIAIFFTTLGLRMDVGSALDQLVPGLALSAFVLVAKPVIFFAIMPRLGFDRRTTFATGITLAQISEFSFIFAALGTSVGLIDEGLLAVIGMVGLTTIAASASLIEYRDRLYTLVQGERWLGYFGARPSRPGRHPKSLHGHVIVVGMNSLGLRLVNELNELGETVLAVDTDPSKLEGLSTRTLLGSIDHPSVLEEASLKEARLVVSALQIEDTNNLLTYRCRQADVPCSIHAFDRSVIRELRQLGANHLMIPKNHGVRRMLTVLRDRGLIES